MPGTTQPRVALLVETSNAYARGLLHGVVAYMREHRPWSIHLAEHGRGDQPPGWLKSWKGDGIIARIENPAIAAALARLKLPIVDVSAARLLPALPWFETDDAAIARLAAEHLLERGFKNFAYCGDARFNWSNWRLEHFAATLKAAGRGCEVFMPPRPRSPDDEGQVNEIADWLVTLPKPLGVMACYDLRGQQVLDACRRRGIAVPDEVAVVGVDNDELLCDLSEPPLSSVIPNTHRTGYEAAALLDQLMAGKKPKPAASLIPPLGVAVRQSTDVLAIDDPNIVKAVRFIRQHACEGINVKDVLRAVPHSRRLLESRFKKLIGRTPHEEIIRVQLNRVKELLTETDLSLEDISERTGFAHVEYLSVVFKKKVGLPPSRYRAVNRR
ncbi:MAG TPA: DNA-binding transcriptional regulator [Roseimicrobium sp.]|nr:DNA-binding transcriptional regulator [Roseimicrobium sp.]